MRLHLPRASFSTHMVAAWMPSSEEEEEELLTPSAMSSACVPKTALVAETSRWPMRQSV